MSRSDSEMDFVPMSSIPKKQDKLDLECTQWVATEKVHGSSFQLFSSDGATINVGSRRKALETSGSFLKCNIRSLLKDYESPALKLWHLVHSQDKWAEYRVPFEGYPDDDVEEDDAEDADDEEKKDHSGVAVDGEECLVRIYGELYGGGGIKKDIKMAVQKEIIYSDEFRFYVFGLTINQKWVTISELNALCKEAGFPYYAKPACEPKASMEELRDYLKESGFMRTKSALSDKEESQKAFIEGVVMTPLSRPDFRLHAVKYLAPAFNDVRDAQFCSSKKTNYCTKQRYHSVISKLDTDERRDTEMVVRMFTEDIIKESPDKNPDAKQRDIWRKVVTKWLRDDEYLGGGGRNLEEKKEQENDEPMGASLFD